MENAEMSVKDMKVEIPFPSEAETTSPTSVQGGGGGGGGGLVRQGSISKSNCLCSPTTHAGSFRCRLHRAQPSLQRSKSIDSSSQAKANASTDTSTRSGSTVEAQ